MDVESFSLDHDRIRIVEAFGKVPSATLVNRSTPMAFGRERELKQLEHHLTDPGKNSFILVGPSGCGKSAVLRELFRRLVRKTDAPWLALETSAGYLLAGCSIIGSLEAKLRDLIRACPREGRVAIYFTDIHAAPDAGKTSKDDMNIADYLTPYVESGDVVLIGECTPEQFRRGIEPNPTFKKLFTVFQLRALDNRQVKQVVKSVAEQVAQEQLAVGRTLTFTSDALTALQDLGKLYYPGVTPPGGALRLMEQMVSHQLREQSSIDDDDADDDDSSTGRTRGDGEEDNLAPDGANPPSPSLNPVLKHQDVIRTLEAFTGIPGMLLDDSQPLELSELRRFFDSRVLGQPEAIESVVDIITLIKAGVTDPSKPMSVLFFVGPTGVGKTELAKALAEYIFGSPDRMLRFDMSEFKDFHSFEKLIGSTDARDNSMVRQGSLLMKVKQQPFSVILLDELEKAHSNIFDLLLQLFDDGRLSDAQGNTTDFTQTLIVMTSNLASNLSDERSGFGFSSSDEPADLEDRIRGEMERFFRPEFINRIGRIVVFQPLKREHMRTLAQRELGQVLLRNGITRRKLRVDVDPGVIDILLQEGFSPLYGARPLKRAVERLALIPIARQIVRMGIDGHQALLRLTPGKNRIQVKIVQDRRARAPEVDAQGVRLVDPASQKKVKLKPADLKERMQNLAADVQTLEMLCEESMLRERKTWLMQQTNRVDFWDTPDRARHVLGEIYRSERLLEAASRVFDRTRRLQEKAGKAGQTAEQVHALAHQVHELQQHADLLRYSLECRGELEQCDAFVQLTVVDEQAEDDFVGKLADMYLNWASQKGFSVTVLHEELLTPKITRTMTLLIEGVSVYGILQGEEGIHEFIVGRTSKSPRISRYAKVRVLPMVDEEALRVPPGELEVEKHKSHGNGLRCKLFKSRVAVTHAPSQLTVAGHSDLSPARATEVLTDLLRAEMHLLRFLDSDDASGDREEILRKYTLKPNQSAKDQRTAVATKNLGDLWQGRGLDEFLYASILARHGRTAEAEREQSTS